MIDLVLAIAHHLLVFGLVAMLAMEAALLRGPGITSAQTRSLSRLDAGYGATAGLILVVGALRVLFGAKGWDYYADNPWFWGKMASFAAVGLLSLPPTLRFVSWRRALTLNPAFVPDPAEIVRTRRFLSLQAIGVASIVVFAAAMARWAG